ncbi:MAG: 3-oxoacyl-ACP synthase [Burkholderiales bacterium]|nr:3-oxoacyl-ACP synthase [Bacteroidia bacterium]
MNTITSYAHIKHNQVSVNGSIVFQSGPLLKLSEFLSEAYKSIGLSYPKFHKMDAQCKLGFLCAEFALKETTFLTENDLSKTAIILSNAASSLETDRVHQHSINDKSNYFPSPAVFVYTLPNITIGEIAIKHKVTGENAFFVSGQLDTELLVNYIETLLSNGSEAALVGWVEVDGASFEAFIFLVESSKNINKNSIFKALNQSSVITIYNQTKWTH